MNAMTPADAAKPVHFNPAHLHDPRPNGYSNAVIAPAAGRVAYISGQGGQDHTGGLSSDFDAQVQQAYANLAAVLEALEAGPDQVVKLVTYVVDHDPSKLGPLTAAVMAMFGESLPAQTLVPVPCLAVPGMLFEVEATVALD